MLTLNISITSENQNSYIALQSQFMVTLGPGSETPCTDAPFCDSHHREGRADLTPLLNAEQKGGLKLTVQTVVNLEKQETSSPAEGVLLQPSQTVVKACVLFMNCDQIAGHKYMKESS